MSARSIDVSCPQCGSSHRVNTRLAGRSVRCPHCDAAVTVPTPPDVLDAEVIDAEVLDGEPADELPRGGKVNGRQAEPVPASDPVEVGDEGTRSAVVFAADPVFDTPGHHAATDLPDLPPALRPEDDDGDPPIRNKRKDEELDMTPMVDVTFLLLIFFMVTASFSLQKSLEMPRQQTDAPSTNVEEDDEEETDMVTVQIDEFGSFLVLAPDWERETPGKQNLIRALKEARNETVGEVRLVVEVHEDCKLRFLVDCMDGAAIADYTEVQVTQVDGFD